MEFARRFQSALGDRDQIWLARKTGLSPSTIHDYAKGAVPSADRVFLIADALEVSPRWLTTGADELAPAGSDNEWVHLRYYPLPNLLARGFEAAHSEIPLRRDWLQWTFGTSEGLWITEMPSTGFPAVAAEGDPVLCTSASNEAEGGLYLLRRAEGATVRRLALTGSGGAFVTDQGDDPLDTHQVRRDWGRPPFVMGRVLGAMLKVI